LSNAVIVSKENEVYLKLDAEADTRRMLSEFFSFEVPGYKFTPQYRSRVWDGRIRLFQYASGRIYLGLLPYIQEFAKQNDITLVYDKGVKEKINDIPVDYLKKYIKTLSSFKIRDYQLDAVRYALQHNRALLLSPTASGKSFVIYCLMRYYLLKKKKILIIVPKTSLVEQLYTDFKDYGFDNITNCHRVYYGYEKTSDKPVIISTWQSLYKFPKEYFTKFGAVFGDEAHLFKARSLTGIMTKLVDCKYRIGLTGTLDETKTHKLVLEGLFGAVNKVTTTKKLMDKKQLSNLKIYAIVLNHTKDSCHYVHDKKYHEEMSFLVSHTPRNKFIRNLCLNLQGNTLCLFTLVEKHGKVLLDMIKKKAENKRKVFFVYGGVEALDREKIRSIVEKEDNAIIVASYGTFSTGINIRNLHNIVFSSPTKSKIRSLQSIGRGLRIGDNKTEATLYDIADNLTYNEKKNYTLEHFSNRINIYNEEDFNYEIHPVELKN
jgi:superfamily II DNA or RNA helicase|tara:strand:- start:3961 stop:5427 length:1467 start_codon:yes stop_codon:yes gene_type:complete